MRFAYRKCRFLLAAILIVFSSLSLQAAGQANEVIIEKMFAMYALDTTSYDIEVMSNRLQTVDLSVDNLVLRPLSPKEPLGSFTVMATVMENGLKIEEAQVRLKIHHYADVVVTIDKIKRRDQLSETNLVIRRMEITTLTEQPITSIEGLLDYRAKRNLNKGRILTTGAIELEPEMDAGREVSIVYSDGLCQIRTAGIAMQSGFAGDYIKVKNKTSGKRIIARIVNSSVVAVDP